MEALVVLRLRIHSSQFRTFPTVMSSVPVVRGSAGRGGSLGERNGWEKIRFHIHFACELFGESTFGSDLAFVQIHGAAVGVIQLFDTPGRIGHPR